MWFKNYTGVFQNKVYLTVTRNTVVWVVCSVLGQMILGLCAALLLNAIGRGKAILTTIILIVPWATPDVVVASTWKWMYNAQFGILNQMLIDLHLIRVPHDWLGSTATSLGSVIVANVWKGFPVTAMLLLAGLKGIPDSYYEAARLDGANIWNQFVHITLPGLRRIFSIAGLLAIIWTMNYFPLVYLMTGGGPVNSSDIFVTNIYRQAFKYYDFGKASAIAMMIFVATLIFTAIYSRVVGTGEGDNQ